MSVLLVVLLVSVVGVCCLCDLMSVIGFAVVGCRCLLLLFVVDVRCCCLL